MNWSDLKKAIDAELRRKGLKDAKVWYIDQQAIAGGKIEVHVEDVHHPGEFEIWID